MRGLEECLKDGAPWDEQEIDSVTGYISMLEHQSVKLEVENKKLRVAMDLAARSARKIGHDKRFTGDGIAAEIEQVLREVRYE